MPATVTETTFVNGRPDDLALDPTPDKAAIGGSPAEISRRRFTIAVIVGIAVVVPLFLWVLWDLWSGSVNPLRAVPYDNFYDLQARAMFHGRLNLPPGKMGIEAFIHNGRQYTYFGIFPSLIRMPILLVTSSLDGKLTAPSILLAWMATGLFSSLMLWRLRILIRGEEVLSRAEAASFGVLMATIMGGSVILYLGATPFVFNEDFAWSVPLTIGSLFALLGVMERPTWSRVTASGFLIVATDLNRTPTGYACVIGAVLVAAWFALGKGGISNRRWSIPLLAIGVVGFAANAAVTYAKFGLPVGLPMADQVWTSVNAHRRQFLAANNGKAFGLHFLPSTAWAYLQPFGLRVTGLFPFITPPTAPAAALDGAVLEWTYPTASIPATMPLLFVLSLWGVITAFRPKAFGQVRLTRIVLLTAAAAGGGVLLWGYIAERYMADFMPLLVLASMIGTIDVWRRLAGRRRRTRRFALGVIGSIAVYSIAANLAIAAWPVQQWTTGQANRFVSAQKSLSIQSAAATVGRGTTLPYWAPAGTIFAMNNCSGLYLSSGNSTKNVPGQQIEHDTWTPVEQDASFSQMIGFTFNRPASDLRGPVPLLAYGAATLAVVPAGGDYVRLKVENSGTSIDWPPATGFPFSITPSELHQQLRITVTIDPNLNTIEVNWYGEKMLGHYIGGKGPAVIEDTPASSDGSLPPISVAELPVAPTVGTGSSLCRSLVHGP